jgi:hypothetical protein
MSLDHFKVYKEVHKPKKPGLWKRIGRYFGMTPEDLQPDAGKNPHGWFRNLISGRW